MKRKILITIFSVIVVALSIAMLSGCTIHFGVQHEHVVTLVERVEPTCESEGNIEYYKCACGKAFLAGGLELKEGEWILPTTEHDYQPVEYYDSAKTYVKKYVCSRNENHVLDNAAIALENVDANAVVNGDETWDNYNLSLKGEFDEISIKGFEKTGEGAGTTENPYIAKREVANFTIDGNGSAVIDGFKLEAGFNVVYITGGHYYQTNYLEIDSLVLKNLTLTRKFQISGNVSIENIILENVTFDFTNSSSSFNAAIHVISQNNVIENVTIKNCNFEKATNCSYGILYDSRTQDNVNITVEGCVFKDFSFNGVQISGNGSCYGGTIKIIGNKITNTADRAIRISNITITAKVEIKDNIMVNASDADGELAKISAIPTGATITVSGNYWGAKEGATAIKGVVNGEGDNVLDTAPPQSAE